MLSWVKRALGSAPPQIFIDAKRINPEIQAERRRELYGSMARRRKIMDRMAQGYACRHPSWLSASPAMQEDDKLHLLTA